MGADHDSEQLRRMDLLSTPQKNFMNKKKFKLKKLSFPKATEDDWYRVEISLGEHLRDAMQKKQEKDTPLLPKSDS